MPRDNEEHARKLRKETAERRLETRRKREAHRLQRKKLWGTPTGPSRAIDKTLSEALKSDKARQKFSQQIQGAFDQAMEHSKWTQEKAHTENFFEMAEAEEAVEQRMGPDPKEAKRRVKKQIRNEMDGAVVRYEWKRIKGLARGISANENAMSRAISDVNTRTLPKEKARAKARAMHIVNQPSVRKATGFVSKVAKSPAGRAIGKAAQSPIVRVVGRVAAPIGIGLTALDTARTTSKIVGRAKRGEWSAGEKEAAKKLKKNRGRGRSVGGRR